jgi:hypothetical protein
VAGAEVAASVGDAMDSAMWDLRLRSGEDGSAVVEEVAVGSVADGGGASFCVRSDGFSHQHAEIMGCDLVNV